MHEVLGSDLGTETRYLARFFCGVHHHLEANSGMVSYFVMLWPHSSMSVQFIVHKYRISAPHGLNYLNVFVMKQ
jgi:hypothetical protein